MNRIFLKIFMLKIIEGNPLFHKNEKPYNGYWFQRLMSRSSAFDEFRILLDELATDGYLEQVVLHPLVNFLLTENGRTYLIEHYSLEQLTPYLMTEDPSGMYVNMLRRIDGLPDLDFAL